MSRRVGGDPVLLLKVAAAALVGGTLALGALTIFLQVNGGSVAGLVVVVAALCVLAAAFLPVPEAPPDREYPRPPGPLPQRDDRVPGAPSVPSRATGPEQPVPWWKLATSPQSDGTGRPAGAGPARHPPQWAQASSPNPAYPASPATRASRPTQAASPAPPPVSVAVPVPGTPWWEAAATGPTGRDGQGTAAAGPTGEAPAEAAVTRVVQCPRCGDFGVDIRQRAPGFAFACNRCGHQWRWEPGTAWPTTVIRPRRKRQQTPAGPNRPDSGR